MGEAEQYARAFVQHIRVEAVGPQQAYPVRELGSLGDEVRVLDLQGRELLVQLQISAQAIFAMHGMIAKIKNGARGQKREYRMSGAAPKLDRKLHGA